MGVRNVEIHEDYEECQEQGSGVCVSSIPTYDVALITLSEDVPMSDYVQPVCLPPLDEDVTYANMVVIGWGNTASGLSYRPADILQKLNLIEGGQTLY